MPTYEYECTSCGHKFECFQSIMDKPKKRCPKCRRKVKRLISGGGGFLFRGNGFYTTDYRSKDYKEKAKAEKESSTPAASKKDKTPAGKPDAPRAGKDKSEKKNKQKSGS